MIGFWGSSDGGTVTLSQTNLSFVFEYPSSGMSPIFVTASPTNMSGPYTYAWNPVTGSADIFAYTPTNQATRFGCTPSSAGDKSAVWKCTVTASNGLVVDSNNITITALDGIS